jgi:aquaporin Z
METAGLGVFMISACIFTVLFFHPLSRVEQAINNVMIQRVLTGAAMGLTSIAIHYSPWGRRSGAHLNPALTLSFLFLGKIRKWDAIFYVLAQFAGGIAGVGVAALLIGMPLMHSAVNYAATVPGPGGPTIAFEAECLISFVLMLTVLLVSNSKRLTRYTSLAAGFLVAAYITIESPVSGMSMNAARTLGSAVFAEEWTALWIYFTAPLLGMLSAAALYRSRFGVARVYCAKLRHHNGGPCIFNCNFGALHAN